MPWLFIDYDQGVGGEYFGANLSWTYGCKTANVDFLENGRIKFIDRFNQEFLSANPSTIPIESHKDLYEIVLSHRNTNLGRRLLSDVFSIRIKNPKDKTIKNCLVNQVKIKVLDPVLPKKYFIGEIRSLLKRNNNNKNFLKKINPNMTGWELLFASRDQPLSEENKNLYLDELYSVFDGPETTDQHNLYLDYEDILFNTGKVKKLISDNFSIVIEGNWLERYRIEYEAYLRTIRPNSSF